MNELFHFLSEPRQHILFKNIHLESVGEEPDIGQVVVAVLLHAAGILLGDDSADNLLMRCDLVLLLFPLVLLSPLEFLQLALLRLLHALRL